MKMTPEKLESEIRRRFADHVTQLRHERGLTHEHLAERSGISGSEIRRLEAGMGQITLTTIAMLADALGVDPVELVVAPRTR